MKKNIFKLGIFVAICGFLIGNVSYATTEFVSPEAPATPVFKFILYNPGEYFVSYEDGKMEQITSDFLLNPQYKKSLIQAAEYWDSILKRPASATTLVPIYVTTKNTEGAFGGSVEVTTDSSPYKISYLNALYNNKAVPTEEAKKAINAIVIGNGICGVPYIPGEINILPLNEPADLTVVLAHEMGHALGILPNTNTTNGTIKFGQLSVWNKDIKADDINGNPISADSGKTIIVNDTSAVNGFNISILSEIDKIIYDSENKAPFAPYFAGTNTLNVLKGGRDDATFKHYQYEYSGLRVKGLPINGVEKNANGNLIAELSHIELRNSYMSHQNYRNWSTFMEAELAVLKDLGYDIELSEHYGKSYYTNENNVTNSNVFTTSKPFGIGLHIYGDNNTITQTGAITSSGIASVGARVEGVENKLTINSDINMSGANSVGILASYGKDHEITINSGTSISATGENGIAASFNFGKNMLGEYIEHRGSYLRAIMGKDIELDDDTAGPLVKNFTVNGKLEGQKAAIYIDDTAYVQQININNSARIEGAILSNWNSRTSGKYAHVQNIDQSYIDGLLLTELNFNNYNKTLYKDIIGDTFIMNLNNSSLTNNATTRVYNLNIDTNSTLEGTANYIIKNNFTNKGAYNGTANGAGISANKIINTGEIGIKGEFNLDAPITGNGTLKIGFGALSIPTIVNFSNSVDKIENKITINENPTLNFANNSATDIEVGKMTFNSDATMSIDVDIATQVADRFNF